ncbi:hypothetical protein KIPB_014695, partial [Kipferlia bialata]|eukprot:g14695.t1
MPPTTHKCLLQSLYPRFYSVAGRLFGGVSNQNPPSQQVSSTVVCTLYTDAFSALSHLFTPSCTGIPGVCVCVTVPPSMTVGVLPHMGYVESEANFKATRQMFAKSGLVKKFRVYSFCKSLTFFEPYLLVLLYRSGLSLFQISLFSAVISGTLYLL